MPRWYAMVALLIGASPVVGCSCAAEDAVPVDASVDVMVALDAPADVWMQADADEPDSMVVDAGLDAGEDAAVDAGMDAGEDAFIDAGWDASDPCADCVANDDCDVATCTNGVCAHSAAVDLTVCTLSDAPSTDAWCVAGACVAAGCGDGVVVDDEACDDVNDVDNDACSNVCTWNRFSIAMDTGSSLTLREGGALAVDGQGTLLLAWHEDVTGVAMTAVNVRRISATGVNLDVTPLVINSSSQGEPYQGVAGLSAGGFAFVYLSGAELYVRTLSADGAVGTARRIPGTYPSNSPASIAPLGSGFVVAWNVSGNLYAQRYSATGTTVGSQITVNTSAGSMLNNSHSLASIASRGDDWLIVWRRTQMPAAPVSASVYGRRFRGGSALHNAEQLYSVYGNSADGPVAITRPSGWLVAYRDVGIDTSGEIYTRVVSDDGVLADQVLESGVDVTTTSESLPVMCGYGDDDYWLAWHLAVNQNTARAVVGSQKDSVMAVPEVAAVNQQIGMNGWIDGLSCARAPIGVWVTWVSNNDVRAQLIPLPGAL